MKHQAKRLAAYAEWERLQVNASDSLEEPELGCSDGSQPHHPQMINPSSHNFWQWH